MKKELCMGMAVVGLLSTSIAAYAFTGQEYAKEASFEF